MEETYKVSWDTKILMWLGYSIIAALIALIIHELVL